MASTVALEIAGDNPIMLVSIEAPTDGGGVNRSGRLAKGSQGKWRFGYYSPGISQGLLIEVTNGKTYDDTVLLNSLGSLQEILPNYIDSSDALTIAEQYGGNKLTEVDVIVCRLLGEATWPSSNPKKIVWEITYKQIDGSQVRLFIDAYNSIFLGRG